MIQLEAISCATCNIYVFNLFDLYYTKDDRGEKQFYPIHDDLSLHLGMEIDVT